MKQRAAGVAASPDPGSDTRNAASRNDPPRIKIAERVAAELRREIARGNLRPGDRLQPEKQLREQFDVSRPTLREALRTLESESLITISRGQHGGARVTPLDLGVLARQVGISLQLEGVTVQDVWQTRIMIEPAAAGLLADNLTTQPLQEMADNIQAARAAIDDPAEFGVLTTAFSSILTRYCGNRTVHLFAQLIQDIVRRQSIDVTVKTYAREGGERMRLLNIRSRETMLKLVRAGDAQAVETFWRNHLQVTARVVLSAYRGQMPIDMV